MAAGLTGAAWLIFHVGFKAIFAAALSVGWGGFALLCAFGAANFVLLGAGWFLIAPPFDWRQLPVFMWGRAVRDCAGDALPFSAVGGMAIGARAVTLFGISPAVAFGSTIVDITLELIGQIMFVVAGLLVLLIQLPGVGLHQPLARMAMIAIGVGSLAAVAFFIVQRQGLTVLERIAARLVPAALAHATALREAVACIHARPARMFINFLSHCVGWLSAAFGTWLTLFLIGRRIGYLDAVAIESMLCAARSAAVFVPSAIGIQEAGYVVMMPLFGVPADIGLAVALLKRSREISLAIPVLISWQIAEAVPRNRSLARS